MPQIEALMAQGHKDLALPGLSYAVLIDGDVVLARGLGLRDVTGGAVVNEDTVFRIASMTKGFTALAVLKLRDAGGLRLDDPVGQHVPELRGWPLPSNDSAPVTLRQLLSHTAGLPEDNPQCDRQLALSAQRFQVPDNPKSARALRLQVTSRCNFVSASMLTSSRARRR